MEQKEKLIEGRKLIDALYELSKENFSVSDDTILDKLYLHIEKKVAGEEFLGLLRDFGVWLEFVLKLWNNSSLCGGVKVFSIRLIGLVGSKPHGFTTIKNMLPEIEKLISSPEILNDSSLMVPLLNDVSLFVNHKEGLDWVLKTGIWKHAVKTFFEDRSIYTNRSGVRFISLLLSKVFNNNKQKGIEVLNFVCEPLVDSRLLFVKYLPKPDRHGNSPLKKDTDAKCVNSVQQKVHAIKHIVRAAKYLCDILDELFVSGSNLPVKFKYIIPPADLIPDNSLSYQEYQKIFLQLQVMLELSNACWENASRKGDSDRWAIVPCPMNQLYQAVHQAARTLMSLGHFSSLMDFCVFCLSRVHRFRVRLWMPSHIHNFSECTKCRELESMLVYQLKMFLELHSTCFCVDPCFIGDFCSAEGTDESTSHNHMDDDCLKKFNEIRSSETLSLQYFQLGVFATARILNFIFYTISREAISTAVTNAFATMMKYFWVWKASMSSSVLHLITLTSKLTEHYINENTSKDLFSTVTWILEKEKEDSRITINTLQLLVQMLKTQVIPDLIIRPPTKDSYFNFLKLKMKFIAASLVTNLKNGSSWEIRDTTLEVYQLVTEVEGLFPGLFNMMFDNNLYCLVMEVAAKDAMAYVRASAFKFFSTTVRAKLFLENLSSNDLCELAVKTLLEDEMPEPRMAACGLLAAIYVTDFLTDQGMSEKLYDAVFVASMKELDWEVKKATLRFWQCTITKLLADEGVPRDPAFLRTSRDPTFNESVVLKILRVMDTLSDIGCFKVLWSDVVDDSEISVSLEASYVINNILDLDAKWNFIDKVLKNFDLDGDRNVLTNKKLRPKEFFINIRKKDWREKLAARKKWIENTCDDLSSLLDHILNPDNNRGDLDYNAVDCY